ncbi:hypothetical protein GUG51_10585, partial [Xanthomonas citri pv. citri]|nr:hypothetical protein [Xanthomonas citri pv. citri]
SRQAGEEKRIFSFDELQDVCGFSLSENPVLAELLADMLVERPEVRLANIRSDCLALSFYPEYCPNGQEEAQDRQSLEESVPQGQ